VLIIGDCAGHHLLHRCLAQGSKDIGGDDEQNDIDTAA
jgi:hypothetical protein